MLLSEKLPEGRLDISEDNDLILVNDHVKCNSSSQALFINLYGEKQFLLFQADLVEDPTLKIAVLPIERLGPIMHNVLVNQDWKIYSASPIALHKALMYSTKDIVEELARSILEVSEFLEETPEGKELSDEDKDILDEIKRLAQSYIKEN